MLIKTTAAITLWGILAGACCCELPLAPKPKAPTAQPPGEMMLAFTDLQRNYDPGENRILLRLTNLTGSAFSADPWYPYPGPGNATVYLRRHGLHDWGAFVPCWDANRHAQTPKSTMNLAAGSVAIFAVEPVFDSEGGAYDIYAELKGHPAIRTEIRQITIGKGHPVTAKTSRNCCP